MSSLSDELAAQRLLAEVARCQLDVEVVLDLIRTCSSPSYREINELNMKASSKLSELSDQLEELRLLATEQSSASVREGLLAAADRHHNQLTQLQQKLKSANVSWKENRNETSRHQLLGGVRRRGSGATQTGPSEELDRAADITAGLTELNKAMARELSRAQASNELLDETSTRIGSTSDEFSAMTGTLRTADSLLSTFERRLFTEKLLVCLAVAFFVLTALYVVKKRVGIPFF